MWSQTKRMMREKVMHSRLFDTYLPDRGVHVEKGI